MCHNYWHILKFIPAITSNVHKMCKWLCFDVNSMQLYHVCGHWTLKSEIKYGLSMMVYRGCLHYCVLQYFVGYRVHFFLKEKKFGITTPFKPHPKFHNFLFLLYSHMLNHSQLYEWVLICVRLCMCPATHDVLWACM